MSLNEIIMRLIQYARTEIFPVIPESDRRVVTAVGITNALRLNQIRQQLEPVGNNIRVSDADIDTLVKYLRGE